MSTLIDELKCNIESIILDNKNNLLIPLKTYQNQFKIKNPDKALDDKDFYLVGEVYNYGISAKKAFDFGDKKVNYFDEAFNGLINFEVKWNANQKPIEEFFKMYSDILNNELKGYGVLNYFSSHDDGQPFDPNRIKSFESATKLLLCPGASQVYYGDESARSLVIEGTVGDATLRSFMNWDDITNNVETQKILNHWQKLGEFRANHPAIGAGIHQIISQEPYLFYHSYEKDDYNDLVVIGLNLEMGQKVLDVSKVFEDGDKLWDAYSKTEATVNNGKIVLDTEFEIVLLEIL